MHATAVNPLDLFAYCRLQPERLDAVDALPGVTTFGPGFVLDERFVLGEQISRSGMATIYKGEDLRDHHRPVAIKVPHLKYENDPMYYGRFLREEELGRKFDHPYLLKFIPLEGTRSRVYNVSEYLPGWTLEQLLRVVRPFPEKDALRIASMVCEAIQHMHERGVIHRDLKPGNIMLCPDKNIRVMDFGLASPIAEAQSFFSTLTPVFGTPQYMAPEQVEARRHDERTDVYSLGALLYEMLTGAMPFPHEDAWVGAQMRVSGDPIAPRQINPAISPEAEEIILHALQRKPADRYQTMAAFKAELDHPEKVDLTGYCLRLTRPRHVYGYETVQLFRGAIFGVGFLGFLVVMFEFLKWHFNPH
jgi:serine/threonine-protein kinase